MYRVQPSPRHFFKFLLLPGSSQPDWPDISANCSGKWLRTRFATTSHELHLATSTTTHSHTHTCYSAGFHPKLNIAGRWSRKEQQQQQAKLVKERQRTHLTPPSQTYRQRERAHERYNLNFPENPVLTDERKPSPAAASPSGSARPAELIPPKAASV